MTAKTVELTYQTPTLSLGQTLLSSLSVFKLFISINIIIYRQITIQEELVLKPVINKVKVHSVQHAM
jgi:hypothetical protein